MSDASKILENINKLQETLENNYLKTITIMFTDLKDSTKYFEKYGDIKGRLFIERHNNMLFPIIKAHNGTIIKTIGDSIMAKFDSPYLAVRSSIEMQKTLDEYNKTATDKIRIRIGIHTGKAIVENNDVFGDAVNVAARIESDTAPSRTTISLATLQGIKEYNNIKTKLLGKVVFKGKSEEMETYSVLWRTSKLDDELKDIVTKKTELDIPTKVKESIALEKKVETMKSRFNKIPKKVLLFSSIGALSLLFILLLVFSSGNSESKDSMKPTLSQDRQQIVKHAKSFIGEKVPKSNKWSKSLSGFVKMVYLHFDIDLTFVNPRKTDGSWKSTTEMIYTYVKNNGLISKNGPPKPGDFIFFDNTYDRNKNKKTDDFLTTVGLIVDIDKEGTVYFLYKLGNTIRVKNMNLKQPHKESLKNKNIIKVLNSKLRGVKKGEKKSIPQLSSQLFNAYGSLLDIDKAGSPTTIADFKLYRTLKDSQRKTIVNYALNFLNTPLNRNILWANTSAGFIKMIFLNFRVNVSNATNKKSKNNKSAGLTELIFNYAKEHGKLYKTKNYQVGDLIFFNNTYDKDKDGRSDDRLTSVGMITEIAKDGTLSFIIKLSNKPVIRFINLKNKNHKDESGKLINSVMKYDKKGKKYAYELVYRFASLFKNQ